MAKQKRDIDLEDDEGEFVTCPQCGKRDDIQCFDVLGACGPCVFCTDCHCEFDPENGAIHKCDVPAQDAERALWPHGTNIITTAPVKRGRKRK